MGTATGLPSFILYDARWLPADAVAAWGAGGIPAAPLSTLLALVTTLLLARRAIRIPLSQMTPSSAHLLSKVHNLRRVLANWQSPRTVSIAVGLLDSWSKQLDGGGCCDGLAAGGRQEDGHVGGVVAGAGGGGGWEVRRVGRHG